MGKFIIKLFFASEPNDAASECLMVRA